MIQSPVQVASHGVELTPVWRQHIIRKAEKLEEYHPRITACRVVVDSPHRRRHRHPYAVRIHLEVPRGYVEVDRVSATSLDEAVEQAFDAAGRRLADLMRKMDRRVKRHEETPTARVATLFLDTGFGFLETPDGREVYFHRNSVLDGKFDRLTPGSLVRFFEERGEKGPQASTVELLKPAPRVERRRRMLRRAGRA